MKSSIKANLGAFFVIDLDLRKVVGQHQHYKTAFNHYKRAGGYGRATIVPAADALIWKFNYAEGTLTEQEKAMFSTTRC
jgi:hypothetical protein